MPNGRGVSKIPALKKQKNHTRNLGIVHVKATAIVLVGYRDSFTTLILARVVFW